MKDSRKYVREILGRDVQISDEVNGKLRETYEMLGKGKQLPEKSVYCRRKNILAAAMSAVLLCAVSGVVYASVRSGFFEGMFGNETKKSTSAITREIDDGKGGKVQVTVPSKEYVTVDEEKADKLIGDKVTEKPVEIQLGEHKLKIENFTYDRNGALMYFTLERKGGVTAFDWSPDSNLNKGAEFSPKADFCYYVESKNGVQGCGNVYVDEAKSTEDKLYCYEYILWAENLKEGDTPQMIVQKWQYTYEEYDRMDEQQRQEAVKTDKIEKIDLSDKKPISMQVMDMGENGYLEVSPISLCVDISKGMGLSEEQAHDDWNVKHVEIKYKDGTSYVVHDRDGEIANTGYVLGAGKWFKAAFNRIVDVNEIKEIIVNDVKFPVGEGK